MSMLSPELFTECLDSVQAGLATIEECAAKYPEHADELRDLLFTAMYISPGPAVEPESYFRSRARSAILTSIAIEKDEAASRSFWRRLWRTIVGRPNPAPAVRNHQAEMPLPVFFALAILVGASSAGVSLAAEESLPGEPLYALKTTTEVVRMSLASSDQDRAELHLTFAARRLDEMEGLAGRGQTAAFKNTAERYTSHVDHAVAISAGKPIGVEVAVLSQRLSLRGKVLAQLYNQVPASAQPAIEAAHAHTLRMEEIPAKGLAATQNLPLATGTPAALAAVEVSHGLSQLQTAVNGVSAEELSGGAARRQMVASLSAAKEAVEHGKPESAANSLNDFASTMDDLQESGRMTASTYQTLYRSYAGVVAKLGATMATSSGATAPRGEPKAAPTPSAGNPGSAPGAVAPTAQPTATPQVQSPARPSPTVVPAAIKAGSLSPLATDLVATPAP